MIMHGQFILLSVQEFAEWLDAEPVDREVLIIQNHHTWKPAYAQFTGNNHMQMLDGMKAYHLSIKFADIAQNITIFPDGKIAICRPLNVAPAGIKGANKNGICIENVGNFDVGGDVMTEVHKDAIIAVNALLVKAFNLTIDTDCIVYHHWYDLNTGVKTWGTGMTKTCPGTNWFGGNKKEDCEAGFLPLIESY
jgi:hypothetical protein